MSDQNQTPSLDDLLDKKEESVPASEDQTEELLNHIIETLSGLGDSMANLHVVNRSLAERVGTLEKFVSYLMSKDPEAGPRMKALYEATEKKNDEVLQDMPAQTV